MATEAPRADPLVFSMRWPVRGYELDSRGHVNNAVYLSWSEEIATAHAEAAGYGREWSERHGGGWVIRRTEITYHRPAVYGDEVELTVQTSTVTTGRGKVWMNALASPPPVTRPMCALTSCTATISG